MTDIFLGQTYHIPPDTSHPEIDAFTCFSEWIAHLEVILGRCLDTEDYIFPGVASTGQLKLGEPTTRNGIERLLEMVTAGSGVMEGRNGKFTTHCFRRGGAQYRFMWAEQKWSLKAVKWWGGWSSNENVSGRLMSYSILLIRESRSVQSCATFWMSLPPTKKASRIFSCQIKVLSDMKLSWALRLHVPVRRLQSRKPILIHYRQILSAKWI